MGQGEPSGGVLGWRLRIAASGVVPVVW